MGIAVASLAVLVAAAAMSWSGTTQGVGLAGGQGTVGPVEPDASMPHVVPDNSTLDARTNELLEDFKSDVRNLLTYKDTDEFEARSAKILQDHEKTLRDVIEHARVTTDTRIMDEIEIQAAIDYILVETIKDEDLKAVRAASQVQEAGFSWIGVPAAHAACPNTTSPSYKQLSLDTNGGLYRGNLYNGGNYLYSVVTYWNQATCSKTFELYFADEDHPYLDAAYDELRKVIWKRTHDIEKFIIHNNNRIEFDNTWSSNNSYDCLTLLQTGCHSTTTKSYRPGSIVYVSNTWNHMMDTSDTNRQLSKINVP